MCRDSCQGTHSLDIPLICDIAQAQSVRPSTNPWGDTIKQDAQLIITCW